MYERTPRAGEGSRTPFEGGKTPVYGSQTPMYGSQTPLHDGKKTILMMYFLTNEKYINSNRYIFMYTINNVCIISIILFQTKNFKYFWFVGSRTPYYGNQTPLHESGSRTPGQSGAWDPTIANTPARYIFSIYYYVHGLWIKIYYICILYIMFFLKNIYFLLNIICISTFTYVKYRHNKSCVLVFPTAENIVEIPKCWKNLYCGQMNPVLTWK